MEAGIKVAYNEIKFEMVLTDLSLGVATLEMHTSSNNLLYVKNAIKHRAEFL